MNDAESYLKREQTKVGNNILALQNEEKQLGDKIRSKKLEEQRSKNKIQAEQNKVKILEDGIDQIEDSIA